MRARTIVARTIAAFVLLAGCRDGVAPFRPEPAADDGTERRTFSSGHDDDPAWLADGALIYAAESFPGVPASPGQLLRLTLDGSAVSPVFPELQSPAFGGPRLLAQPAVSPDGGRVAYVHLARVTEPVPGAVGEPCFLPEPLLDSVAIHVRALDGGDPPAQRPIVGFPVAGRDRDQDRGLPGPYEQTIYPFHLAFLEQQHVLLRASWSPDGRRLVYSDGLRLYVHTLGGGTSPLASTGDGVSPAWDPTGEWIAFTRVERTDSVTYACSVAGPPGATLHIRTGYPNVRPQLSLIRPDGTGLRVLGEGWDAAWSPDGATLYFRRDDRVWRVPRDGGTAEPLDGTERGRSPAISPDDTHMALARRSEAGDWDVWVVVLSR